MAKYKARINSLLGRNLEQDLTQLSVGTLLLIASQVKDKRREIGQ